MASKSKITVHEKQVKNVKGIPTAYFKTIKTNGSAEDAEKAVAGLKKRQSVQFEVRNPQNGHKTVYKKLNHGTVYEVKVC